DFSQPFRIAGEAQAAVHLPSRGLSGFLFQVGVELDAVLQELRDVGRGPQLSDQAGRMPSRSARQLVPLEQNDFAPAELGQVVSRTAPYDAATDNDGTRRRRN